MSITVVIFVPGQLVVVRNRFSQLLKEIGEAKDKSHLMRAIEEIIDLSERNVNFEAVDALCCIITDDWSVRHAALAAIDKIKRK